MRNAYHIGWIARAAMRDADYPRAADLFELSVTVTPGFARGWYALGSTLWSHPDQRVRMISAWQNGVRVGHNDASAERCLMV